MVDKLLEGHNDLMNLKDILASASRLRGELKGRLSRRLVPNVHLSLILPREIEWTEAGTRMDWKCVACGLVDLKVRDQPSIAMVDTGAEMNIIRERDATMLGLEVDHSDHGVLHGANCKAIFCSTASNVMVEIGRVRARTCFFVMRDVDHPILLGRSFLCRTETLVFNRHEGTMLLALSDPACGNYEIIKCRNTGPGSGRNRLNFGSFTFEESEYARRRLREEQEEEGAGEVLSLSLNDVNKAMEVLAAHDMADPEAIKALREQVLESPQVGEVELVYRFPGRRGDPVMAQARTTSRPFLGGWLKQGSQSRYKTIDKKCHPVPVLVTEAEEVYYERERGLIRRMRKRAQAWSCRINNENEEGLIIGESGFLSPQERTLMVETMRRRHCAYAFNDDERGRLDVDKIPMIRIHTVPHEPWKLRGARYPNPNEEKKVVDYLDGKMRTYVADYSSGPYASPWFCFIQPNGTLRWVQDLQRLNAVTVRDAGGLSNEDALSESCAGRPIISLIDLYSGYDQFLVYPPDRPMTAMHTPRGLIHMNVTPQGWTNAVAMVQRHMIRVMQTVSPHITQPYIDDLAVKGPKEKEENEVMPGVRREATIMGFVCNEKGRRPDVKKTDKILEWSVPFQSITDVRSFLGTCGFWRNFVKDFATKTEHLRKLVCQDQEWVWGEDQEKAVERIKGEFGEGGLVLGAPNYEVTKEKPFVVETDAGPTALGGVLIQADADGKERPLGFESRTLNTTERNYSQFKKETLAVLHYLRTFWNYIFGRRLILRVDSTALACSLKSYTPSDPTIARWLTYIWMFNFELERIPRDKNRADGLSRINWDGACQESIEDTPPVDGFLDQEEDVRLHINEWSLRVPSCVIHPIWLAPRGYEQKEELVLKPFQEEDPWGSRDVGWMMKLALAETHSLVEEVRTIEEGPTKVEEHEQLMGGMYLLTNTLLQGNFDQRSTASSEEGELLIPESQDDEFEEREIREVFRAEEYDGIYRELGLLLSCEMRDRDASAKAQKMRHLYVVRTLLAGYGVVANYTTVAHPQANAPVERGHMTIMNLLAKWTEGKPNQWPKFLRATFFMENVTVKRTTKSDFSKAVMQRGGRDTRPRQGPQRMEKRGKQHEPPRREPTPEFDDDNIELFLDVYRDHAAQRRCEELRPPSPLPSTQELDIPRETPFRSLATHLDVSQWEASRLGEDSVEPACYVPLEEPLDPEMETDMRGQEEPQDPEMAAERPDPERPQVGEVITVGDDTPPYSPAPELAQRSWPEGIPKPGSEEIPESPPAATLMPEQEAEAEDQGVCERAKVEAPPDLPSSTHVTRSPVIEEPVPAELPPVVPCASEGRRAEAMAPEGQGPQVRGTPRETREEKSARVRVRLDEIHAKQDEMEEAGIEPTPPSSPRQASRGLTSCGLGVVELGSSSGGPSSGRADEGGALGRSRGGEWRAGVAYGHVHGEEGFALA
ncbi:hypothetical protein CBR_g40158 [Chara braunii]|uniref:RNA-directed DNA polymerase n=1 Tax=Chara braunii TaxID=69332 RepID=A0A388LT77_CHABU|nr:hypothetical protein CBR_g40158 [Chara braunii]|eukprot:GBG85520.1 hypothetical protein CBR_g40158 [Chara braunii]